MDHDQAAALFSEFLDGTIAARDKAALEQHLAALSRAAIVPSRNSENSAAAWSWSMIVRCSCVPPHAHRV